MITKAAFRLVSELARLVRDRNGQVVIYFTILAPVMLGLIGLSLEGGRLLMLNSQLQDLADASALAGAKELDGGNDAGNDAITRAINAAENVLNNTCTTQNDFQRCWSTDNSFGVQIVDPPIFYSKLKGQPTDNPAPNNVITTDPTQANYIQVTTVTRQLTPAFLVAVGATSIAQTSATATAGSTYVACNVQPLMLCNPYQPLRQEFHATAGQQFRMKVLNDPSQGGGSQSFAPGDFGLLDPPGEDSSGANTIRNLLSQQSPNFCYVDNVSPRTGQAVQKVNDGISVRFDIPPNGNTTGLDQTPAPDVIKGLLPKSGNACNGQYTDLGASDRLPRDSSWTTIGNMQIGNGTLVFPDSYWQYHFGANWPTNNGTPLTRYQAYLQELNLAIKAGTENKTPVCTATSPSESTAQRRIVSVAIIDCLAADGTPLIKGNSTANVRSKAYADFFITEPSTTITGTSGEVWAEFVQMVTPQSTGGTGKLHQIIQLYRDCDPAGNPGLPPCPP